MTKPRSKFHESLAKAMPSFFGEKEKPHVKHAAAHPTHAGVREVHHAKPKKAGFLTSLQNASRPNLSIKQQTFFVKRLSFLIKASVPILEGLTMVAEQTKSGSYGRVLESVIADVSNGTSLSKSLGKFPHIFGDFGINIIKIGESSGTLSQNLDYLADELKKRDSLQKKVASAFVYPVVILCATLGITAFLILYLFPKIMPVFASLHAELPWSTKVVIALSTFFQHWGLVFIGGVVLFIIAFSIFLKMSERARFAFDVVMMRIPAIGPMVRYYNLANILRTLGLLLKSGVVLSSGLLLTADTTRNLVYKKELKLLAEAVNRGERVGEHLKTNTYLFPPVMNQMVAVGERTGNLSNTLVYLSELYEAEVEDFTKTLPTLIEPVMMVVMGVLVGFIAISIITPIYGITQNLTPH